jgi:hypothetical protein
MLPNDEREANLQRQKNFYGEKTLKSYTQLIDRIVKPI